MQRNVKDRSGQLLGWVRDDKSSAFAYDRQGKLLGWYNRKTGQTHDSRGRLLTTSGDVTSGLIFDHGEDDSE
jgi:YD repeat-containing protein